MFFSILTPCYNSAPFIGETINSLLSQNFDDWELLLINDGSKDNTLEVLNTLAKKDARIKVIDQVNSGVSVSRNNGIVQAAGQWIVFLDHDDAFMPNALQDLKNLIDNTPKAQCFIFPYYGKKEDNQIEECIDKVFCNFGNQTFTGTKAFELLYSQKEYRGQHWQPWRLVFRKENPPIFTPNVIHEDLDAVPFYIASLPAVCIAAKPFYCYTLDAPTAVTRSFSPKRVKDICNVTEKLYLQMEEIVAGKSNLTLSKEVLEGFKSAIAFNLYGYFFAVASFDEVERNQALELFEKRKEWLLAIDKPFFQAKVKRFLLHLLGVKKTSFLLHLLRK